MRVDHRPGGRPAVRGKEHPSRCGRGPGRRVRTNRRQRRHVPLPQGAPKQRGVSVACQGKRPTSPHPGHRHQPWSARAPIASTTRRYARGTDARRVRHPVPPAAGTGAVCLQSASRLTAMLPHTTSRSRSGTSRLTFVQVRLPGVQVRLPGEGTRVSLKSYSRQVWPGERDLIGEASGNDDLAVRKHEACPTIGKHSHDHRVPPEFVPPEFRRKSDPTRAPAPSATPGCSGRGNILAQRGHASRWHRCCATGRDAGPHRQHVGRLRPPADPVPGTKRRTGQQRCSERARATPRGADRAAARRETAGWPWSMTHAIARYR